MLGTQCAVLEEGLAQRDKSTVLVTNTVLQATISSNEMILRKNICFFPGAGGERDNQSTVPLSHVEAQGIEPGTSA